MTRWPTRPLGDLVSLEYGKALRAQERSTIGRYPVYGSNGVVGSFDEAIVKEPTIVVGRKGAIGEAHLAANGCWPIDTAFYTVLRQPASISLPYLLLWFRSVDLKSLAITSTIPGLNRSTLYSQEVPVPPLPEQERIVKLLDEADELRKLRAQADRRTADLIPALFHEMFGDPATNPMCWKEGKLGDVIHAAKDGPHVSPRYAENGVPFLSARHIKPGEVIWNDLKYLARSDAEIHWKKCKPERGDILYTKGGTTGVATAIDFDTDIAVWVHIALLKTNHEKVDPFWLESMLNSEFCYQQSQQLTHGITNRDLGLTRMIRIQLFIPPLVLQKEFAVRVAEIRAMATQQAASRRRLDALFQSLLHRAFQGEL